MFVFMYIYNCKFVFINNWGLGIGDWGLGPIPNPQSPIPNQIYNNFYNKYKFIQYNIICVIINILITYLFYISIYIN